MRDRVNKPRARTHTHTGQREREREREICPLGGNINLFEKKKKHGPPPEPLLPPPHPSRIITSLYGASHHSHTKSAAVSSSGRGARRRRHVRARPLCHSHRALPNLHHARSRCGAVDTFTASLSLPPPTHPLHPSKCRQL